MKMEKEQARWIYKTMNEIRFLKRRYTKFLVMVKSQDLYIYMSVKKPLPQGSCHN